MVKDREQIIQEMYEDLLSIPWQVYSVFAEYFGEDNVDLQDLPTLQDFKALLEVKSLGSIFTFTQNIKTQLWFNLLEEHSFNEITDDDPYYEKLVKLFIPALRETYSSMLNEPSILIKFGDITVSNERNASILIHDLWAKVGITMNGGTEGFQLIRSKFNKVQFEAKYIHSHVRQLDYGHLSEFKIPCLGRGPINNTINTLASFGYDQDVWGLFCFELEKYIHVESISGVPYNRLSQVTSKETSVIISHFDMQLFDRSTLVQYSDILKPFIEYLIKSRTLRFNYVDGSYGIAMSYVEYMTVLSNQFINLYNSTSTSWTLDNLFERSFLTKGIIKGFSIEFSEDQELTSSLSQYNGITLFSFKGNPVYFSIIESDNEEDRGVIFLNNGIAQTILKVILDTINTNYGTYDRETKLHYTKKKIRVI